MKPYTGMLFILTKCRMLNHSFFFNGTGSGLSMPFWDFLGSTVISSNYIRLTSDLQSKSGAIWNIVVRKHT